MSAFPVAGGKFFIGFGFIDRSFRTHNSSIGLLELGLFFLQISFISHIVDLRQYHSGFDLRTVIHIFAVGIFAETHNLAVDLSPHVDQLFRLHGTGGGNGAPDVAACHSIDLEFQRGSRFGAFPEKEPVNRSCGGRQYNKYNQNLEQFFHYLTSLSITYLFSSTGVKE